MSESNAGKEGSGDHLSLVELELAEFIASTSSTFACGGSICIATANNASRRSPRLGEMASNASDNKATEEVDNAKDDDGVPSTQPITLRWDSPNGSVSKITFPITDEPRFAELLHDCDPASFGYKGSDVLDNKYRNAAKMFRSAFSSDFCPYELGIIDSLAQVLLPNTKKAAPATKGVRAELYALNIYSAPSGLFKAHVDTPHSETQFGSLVVCLPSHHEGGQLVVRHADHSITYDWGPSSSSDGTNAIRWAAFYSDCEHEVREVSKGHRVTLTYNLHYAPGVGDLAGYAPAMQATALPLYRKVESVLADPAFMRRGGTLGIYCAHGYAHSSHSTRQALPAVLKGIDMAVYAVFCAHGLAVDVRPVAERVPGRIEDDEKYDSSPEFNTRVADSSAGLTVSDVGGNDDDEWDDIWAEWPHSQRDVHWLTQPNAKGLWDASFVHMLYGNQPCINVVYTRAAMLIEVPPAEKREQVIKISSASARGVKRQAEP